MVNTGNPMVNASTIASPTSPGFRNTSLIALAAMASLMALLGENFFAPADRGATCQAQLFLLLAVAARVDAPAARQPAPERRGSVR